MATLPQKQNDIERLAVWQETCRRLGVYDPPTLFQWWQAYLRRPLAADNGSLCAVGKGECVGLFSRIVLYLNEAQLSGLTS